MSFCVDSFLTSFFLSLLLLSCLRISFFSAILTGPSGSRNLGHRLPHKKGYFPVAPIDKSVNLRTEMLLTMGDIGIPIEKHHHEVGNCQHELGFTFRTLVDAADSMMAYKYVVKNVAQKAGKTATFMPKPIAGDCGSGMHSHQSLWKDGKNLFFDEKGSYMKLSQTALWYIGGLLKHASAVLAFTNSTTNSYKRLVPGFEAPCRLTYSKVPNTKRQREGRGGRGGRGAT